MPTRLPTHTPTSISNQLADKLPAASASLGFPQLPNQVPAASRLTPSCGSCLSTTAMSRLSSSMSTAMDSPMEGRCTLTAMGVPSFSRPRYTWGCVGPQEFRWGFASFVFEPPAIHLKG